MSVKTKEDLIQKWREYYNISPKEQSDEELWKEQTDLPNLYGDLEDDDDWYYIINEKLKETYGYWFIDEKWLKRCIDDAHMATSNVQKIIEQVTRRVHSNIKKSIVMLEAIDKNKESWIGQNNY